MKGRTVQRLKAKKANLQTNAKMVEEGKRRLINKVIREKLSAYQFTNLSDELMEFAELQKMFKQLMKKKDQEKFHTMFYAT